MAYRFVARVGNVDLRIPLEHGRFRVGSGADCEIRLGDPTVSREHALIEVTDGRVQVTDLGSRNGTRVDSRRLVKDEAIELATEQALRFGHVDARIVALDEAELDSAIAGTEGATAPRVESPTVQTLATGDFGNFCLHRLPALIRRLSSNHGSVDEAGFAGALCEALQSLLPDATIEILRLSAEGESVLAHSGSGTAGRRLTHANEQHRLDIELADEAGARTATALAPLLLDLLGLAQRKGRDQSGKASAKSTPPALPDPPTMDPALQEIYRQAGVIGSGSINVVVEGESGTGKELLARYLHAAGGANRPWVALNCASLPRDLLEAELFGIEKGVATGVEARAGRFEQAHGGTLFLDEIGDMAPDSQAKILRVLQEHEVYRLGGSRPRPAEVAIVAATNQSLDDMVKAGTFRLDLYHRLADWTVTLPALRERRADIANLAACFLQGACEKRGIRFGGVSRAALDTLQGYDWPGNVRELEREMQRAALFINDGEM
ncbi:sigma 54-interacting transcriptional regulator, partial [Dokdonella sp.]|uniref:sigma 54-interacting transcriptional regulator n=1 Tax=Dokdonella sp. TaxID=2291710 RepID=UPI003C6F30BC